MNLGVPSPDLPAPFERLSPDSSPVSWLSRELDPRRQTDRSSGRISSGHQIERQFELEEEGHTVLGGGDWRRTRTPPRLPSSRADPILRIALSPDGTTIATTTGHLDEKFIDREDRALYLVDVHGDEGAAAAAAEGRPSDGIC